MKLPKTYKCLKTNIFSDSKFKIIPIRFEDSIEIMNWRNEQIEILRQSEKLTSDKQIEYFSTVVNKLFYEKEPSQLLFSFFYEEELIGYGGLVHIDWENCNSEISSSLLDNRYTLWPILTGLMRLKLLLQPMDELQESNS